MLNESVIRRDLSKCLNEMELGKDINYNVSITYDPKSECSVDYLEPQEYRVVSQNELKSELEKDFGRYFEDHEFEEMFNDIKNGGLYKFDTENYHVTVSVTTTEYSIGSKVHDIMTPFVIHGAIATIRDSYNCIIELKVSAPSEKISIDNFESEFSKKFFAMTSNLEDYPSLSFDMRQAGNEIKGTVTISGLNADQVEKYKLLPWKAFKQMKTN